MTIRPDLTVDPCNKLCTYKDYSSAISVACVCLAVKAYHITPDIVDVLKTYITEAKMREDDLGIFQKIKKRGSKAVL